MARAVLEAPQFHEWLNDDDLPELVDRARAAVAGAGTGCDVLVAELDGAVTGYAHVTWVTTVYLPGPEGYVTELFVVKAARGRGCGSALLDEIEALAARRHAARLFLLNSRESEAYLRDFYLTKGFTETTHLAPLRRRRRLG